MSLVLMKNKEYGQGKTTVSAPRHSGAKLRAEIQRYNLQM